MELAKCIKGHIYNSNKKECPYCVKTNIKSQEIEVSSTVSKTLVFIEENIEAVVGWLVCIEGAKIGQDYKLYEGRNSLGSSLEEDICVLGDDNIEANSHLIITYNSKQRVFVISPGNTGSIVYVNKKAIYETTRIENFNLIEIGNTKLVFVKFCGENFSW